MPPDDESFDYHCAAWAKYKNQSTAIAIAIGLVSLVAIFELHDRAEKWASEKQNELTPIKRNGPTEEIVHKWLERAGYSIAKQKPSKDYVFAYKVTFDGIIFGVYQRIDEPSILFVDSDMEYSKITDKLSNEQINIFGLKIEKELLMYGMDNVSVNRMGVKVSSAFQYDESMNWIDFVHNVAHVRRAVHLVTVLADIEQASLNSQVKPLHPAR